jgi:hypothetical protein
MKRFALFALLASLAGTVLLAPLSPAAAQTSTQPVKNTFKNIPVTGTVDGGGAFEGTLNITSFEAEGDQQLVAVGTLSGVLKDLPNGETKQVQNEAVRWPVKAINGKPLPQKQASASSEDAGLFARLDTSSASDFQQIPPTPGSCEILTLDLGPLDLNLLGLRVALDEVHLLIEAIPGAGELLGNLLCAVAGLLDGGFPPGVLGQIAGILNQIIQIIGLLG